MASIRFVLSLLSAIALWFVPQLANAENNKLFMWKATHGKSTVYLVGSIHLVPRDFYPLPKDMEKALEDSQTLVLEIKNPDDPSGQKKAVELGMYFDGDNIENHLSDETKTALSKYTANCDKMTAMALYKMRPWCASTTIELLELQKRGFDKDFGLDKHFLKEAQDQKKPVEELENAEFQLNLLSGFSEDMQDKMLKSTLLDAETIDQDTKEMLAAWKSGDLETMEKVATKAEKEHPELKPLMDKLLYERNEGMVEKIEKYLSSGKKTFVVVGAAHMVGPRGLIAQLRDKKYKVEQV
jgi:uncharacterized protein